jgi:hypothetical protein
LPLHFSCQWACLASERNRAEATRGWTPILFLVIPRFLTGQDAVFRGYGVRTCRKPAWTWARTGTDCVGARPSCRSRTRGTPHECIWQKQAAELLGPGRLAESFCGISNSGRG